MIDRQGGGAIGFGSAGVLSQRERDLGLTGFLLKLPERFEQGVDRFSRGWIGAGITGDQHTLVEIRRGGVNSDGVEV